MKSILILIATIIVCNICIMIKEQENKAIIIDCKLLNRNFEGSTLFDCNDYGILISDDEEIFRKAKENNKLKVYFGDKFYKIFDLI